MASAIKAKGKIKNGVLEVKMQIKHAMLTYDQAKAKGKEANFITHITAKIGDMVIFDASTSQFLSKDPIIKYQVKADGIKDGDVITTTYVDLQGNTETDVSKGIKAK